MNRRVTHRRSGALSVLHENEVFGNYVLPEPLAATLGLQTGNFKPTLDKERDAVAAAFGVERVGRVVKFELLRSAEDRGIRVRALGREEVFLRCVLKKDCG